jgi:hypothetical protein
MTDDGGGEERSSPAGVVVALLAAVVLIGSFGVAWAVTAALAGDDDDPQTAELDPVMAVPVAPLAFEREGETTEILIAPEGPPPEEVALELEAGPDEAEAAESDAETLDDDASAEARRFFAIPDEYLEPDDALLDPEGDPEGVTEPVEEGTVPIPDEPGPIEPPPEGGDPGPDDGEPDAPPEVGAPDFDPWRVPTPIPRLVDPCAADPDPDDDSDSTTSSETTGTSPDAVPDPEAGGDDCPPGYTGIVVPFHDGPHLVIHDATSDTAGYCDDQLDELPRDQYGLAILSDRPATFDVQSQPSHPDAPTDEETVTTPDAEVTRWEDDPDSTAITCVALDRRYDEDDTVEESRYHVTVTEVDPDSDHPSALERWVTLDPSGRPEVWITALDDRWFTVAVPKSNDEEVIVALLPRGEDSANPCDDIDAAAWDWPDGARGMTPTSRTRASSPAGSAWASTFWRYHYQARLRDGTPQMLCVIWFKDFVPAPVVTERQSYAIDPPRRPVAEIRVIDILEPPGGRAHPDPLYLIPTVPEAGVAFAVKGLDGALRCSIYAGPSVGTFPTDETYLPTTSCPVDVQADDPGALVTLHSLYQYDEASPVTAGDAIPIALGFDGIACSAPVCHATTLVPLVTSDDPRRPDNAADYRGTAVLDVSINDPGGTGTEWTINPTGPFTPEGVEPPDHPQLNVAGSQLTVDDTLPASVLIADWTTDRPARVSATWSAVGEPTTSQPPEILYQPAEPLECAGAPTEGLAAGTGELATTGRILLPVRCPDLEWDVTLRVEGEDGTVVEYGNDPTGESITYPWDGGRIRTERLPVLVEWSIRNRQTEGPLLDSSPARFGSPDSHWGIDLTVLLDGHRTRVERGSWFDREACGNYQDFDADSGGPVRIEVGTEMRVSFSSYSSNFGECKFGAYTGGRRRGYANVYRDNYGSHTSVYVLDAIRVGSPQVFTASECTVMWSPCGERLTSELVVTVRPEDPSYRQAEIVGDFFTAPCIRRRGMTCPTE